jgi:hypothetical protein
MSDAVMVPRAWLEAFRRDTDPTEPIADNGGTVWDMFCHEAAAMLAASPSVGGWEDISTAPKDGSEIIAYSQDVSGTTGLNPFVSLCAWHPDAGFCTCELREVTHWMPLPPPPSVSIGSRPQEAVPTEREVRLVLAARAVAFGDHFSPAAIKELDAASEAYAADVLWEDEPEQVCICVATGQGPEGCGICNETGTTPQPADGCSSNEGAV